MVNYTNYTTGESKTTTLGIAQSLRDKNEWDVVFIGDDTINPTFMLGCSCGFTKLAGKCHGRKRTAPRPGVKPQVFLLKLLRADT